MRMTLTAALGLCWANRAECCQRKSGSQDYGVWWFPQEAKRTADKASCRGQTPVELQSLDNDNHNRASGILSQDVFVQLHLHSSSEVLPFFIRAKCPYIITIWAIENVFCVCIAWYKHQRGCENSRQLCKPETKSRVCITTENSPNPSSVYIRICKHRKKSFLLLLWNNFPEK